MIHIPVLPLGLFIVGASSVASTGYMVYDYIRVKQEEAWFIEGDIDDRDITSCIFLATEEKRTEEELIKECERALQLLRQNRLS